MMGRYVSLVPVLGLAWASFPAHAPGEEPDVNSVGIRLVRIEPGSFFMGGRNPTPPEKLKGPELLLNGDWDERPVHRVTITRPFRISETEITEDQFRQFRPDRGGSGKHSPFISGVSWYDADAFCDWLSRKEDRPYRLPTEAEWEYACRAGTETLFSSGGDPPSHGTPNAWGLKNMHTGPPEWCLDWHGMYPNADQVDPVGPSAGFARVVRGGGLQVTTPYYARSANRGGVAPGYSGQHAIGFRVVQAPMPSTVPLAEEVPFVRQCVKQTAAPTKPRPPADKPYFRKRHILPIPPENDQDDAGPAAGLHPAILAHNHSPGLVACPNGDLLAIYFSSTTNQAEYWPNVAFIATRLRYGADQWDMPCLFYDFPDVNDQTALLWNDKGTLHLFTGGIGLPGVPFRWCSSNDNGATWTEIRFPVLEGPVGPHYPQPITSAFRDPKGAMYLSSDGEGGTSLLWSSHNHGQTWFDTGGRTGGRHTTFVLLKDGGILGIGGKNTNIDGFMPQSLSRDGGRTWQVSTTPFPALGGNQRPTVIRLAGGRLFFAGDFQDIRGQHPPDVTERGAFVALSDDEGRIWHKKRLSAAEPHESKTIPKIKRKWFSAGHSDATLGYSVACQSSDGMIHLITSMNHPALHFEMNEAWILSNENEAERTANSATARESRAYREKYPSGKIKAAWGAAMGADSRYLLHGPETWYYEDGRKQWEVTYRAGRRVGAETYWAGDGTRCWDWEHGDDGADVWTQWWPNGRKKVQSTWRHGRCHGTATQWDPSGNIIGRTDFSEGIPVSSQ